MTMDASEGTNGVKLGVLANLAKTVSVCRFVLLDFFSLAFPSTDEFNISNFGLKDVMVVQIVGTNMSKCNISEALII
jgi:hypothetical protein